MGLGLASQFLEDQMFIGILIDLFSQASTFLTAHPSPIHLFLEQLESLLGSDYLALSHVDLHVVGHLADQPRR